MTSTPRQIATDVRKVPKGTGNPGAIAVRAQVVLPTDPNATPPDFLPLSPLVARLETTLKRLLRSSAAADESAFAQDTEAVRAMMLNCARMIRKGQQLLEKREQGREDSVRGSTRSGFLMMLDELIGPKPEDRTWHDEWMELNQETARLRGFPIPTEAMLTGDGKYAAATKLKTYQSQVDFKTERGWSLEDAEAHVALSGVCMTAISDSIRQRSSRFAASAHAVYDALALAAQRQAQELPKPVFAFINTGGDKPAGLAVEVDEQFAELSRPDANGFRGFSCPGEVFAAGDDVLDKLFPGNGLPPQQRRLVHGQEEYLPVENGDVVAILPKQPNGRMLHQPIATNGGSYRVPPNSLITLLRYREPGEWLAPNGVRPGCGCYEVAVTFYALAQGGREKRALAEGAEGAPDNPHSPLAGAAGRRKGREPRRDGVPSKLLADVPTLSYADRTTYARGLKELEGALPLTVAQEWQRDDIWTAHDGSRFSAALEFAYVSGVAGERPAETTNHIFMLNTFAGQRDEGHVGLSLSDFTEVANSYVRKQAAMGGMTVEPKLHQLTEEEVCALRLYTGPGYQVTVPNHEPIPSLAPITSLRLCTGPGYQVINTFLREMGKLSEPMRRKLACSPELTYAATTRAICSGIRKLARVNPSGKASLLPKRAKLVWDKQRMMMQAGITFKRAGTQKLEPIASADEVGAALIASASRAYAQDSAETAEQSLRTSIGYAQDSAETAEQTNVALRWRGVRGNLPSSFFTPSDKLGTVVATELGLMSTSTSIETPCHYMVGTSNVLWELRTRPEDEHGYHQGADVSMISQFSAEKEELFPPLTMLTVMLKSGDGAHGSANHEEGDSPKGQQQRLHKAASNVLDRLSMGDIVGDGEGEPTEMTFAALMEQEHMQEFMRKWEASIEYIDDRKFLKIVVEPTFV